MLYFFGQCVANQSILHHHNATLEAADLIEVLCSRIEVLAGWGYSDQQWIWLKEWLDRVAGTGDKLFGPMGKRWF